MGQKNLSKFSFASFQSVWLGLCFDFDFLTLSEKCPNTEFLLVCTCLYSNWILTFTRTKYVYLLRKYPYLVRIQENTDLKKLRIWALFMQYQNGTTIFCSFHISFFKVKDWSFTAQKVKLSIKDFFSKCDQMSHLLNKSLTENFIFVQFFSVDWRRFKKMCRPKGLLDFGN